MTEPVWVENVAYVGGLIIARIRPVAGIVNNGLKYLLISSVFSGKYETVEDAKKAFNKAYKKGKRND